MKKVTLFFAVICACFSTNLKAQTKKSNFKMDASVQKFVNEHNMEIEVDSSKVSENGGLFVIVRYKKDDKHISPDGLHMPGITSVKIKNNAVIAERHFPKEQTLSKKADGSVVFTFTLERENATKQEFCISCTGEQEKIPF